MRYINYSTLSEICKLDDTNIILPCGFGGEKCPVKHCMEKESYNFINTKKKINLKTMAIYERILMAISAIYKHSVASNRRIQSIDRKIKNCMPEFEMEMYGNHGHSFQYNCGNPNKDITREIVEFLIKYEFIVITDFEVSYIDHITTHKKKARTYIMGREYYHRRSVQYQLTSNPLKKFVLNIKKMLIANDENSTIRFNSLAVADSTIARMSFPTYESIAEIASEMVKNGCKDKYNRVYVDIVPVDAWHADNGKIITKTHRNGRTTTYKITGKMKKDAMIVDINIHLQQYDLFLNNGMHLTPHRVYDKKYQDRFYYGIAMLPAWIRDEILLDGQPIVGIDATALHNRLVGMLYSKMTGNKIPEYLKGDSHTNIAKILNIPRSQAKIIGLSYWNSRMLCIDDGNDRYIKTLASSINKSLFESMDKYIENNDKPLLEWLMGIKCDMNSIKKGNRHSNLSVLLMDSEVRMMDKFILDNLIDESFIYCYDAIYVKQDIAIDISDKFVNFVDCYTNVA